MKKNTFLKKINNWRLIGIVLLLSGLLRYLVAFYSPGENTFWNMFWVCPLAAVLAGMAILLKDKFLISGSFIWMVTGPLSVVLFETDKSFSLLGFHHLVSVIALILILFHWKEIYNPEGIIFGVISFYAYMMITSSLSNGAVNLFDSVPIQFGLFLALVSILIFWWNRSTFKE